MIPSRRPGGIHPRPEISHRLQHCDAYARSLNLPLFSRISLIRSMKALQLMGVQVNVIFIAACCRRAEEERKPRRRAAGGSRGRSISMSAHRLNAIESDGQQMAPGEHRFAGSLLCRTCSQVAERYPFHDLSDVYGRTKRAERGKSATAAVAPDPKHKKWNRRRQRYSCSLPSRACARRPTLLDLRLRVRRKEATAHADNAATEFVKREGNSAGMPGEMSHNTSMTA